MSSFNATKAMASGFLEVVVIHLDSKDDDATSAGDEVGGEQVPVTKKCTLHHEGSASDGHRDEARKRNTVGVACSNGLDGLRQISEDESEGSYPTTGVD